MTEKPVINLKQLFLKDQSINLAESLLKIEMILSLRCAVLSVKVGFKGKLLYMHWQLFCSYGIASVADQNWYITRFNK